MIFEYVIAMAIVFGFLFGLILPLSIILWRAVIEEVRI